MLEEIFKSLNRYKSEPNFFYNSDILFDFLRKLDRIIERSPIIDAIINKALELLLLSNKDKIIDLNQLLFLIQVLSKQFFFSVSVAERILSIIDENIDQVYFKPKHYIPLVIRGISDLFFKNKDLYKNEKFVSILKQLLTKENLKYLDDYSFIIMILSVNYIKALRDDKELKFLLEYTISP